MKNTLLNISIIRALSYLILVVPILSCSKKAASDQNETETPTATVSLTAAQEKNAGIVLDSLHSIEFETVIKANGIVDVPPQHLASVSVPMAGYVDESSILPGQHVHKGTVLATIYHPSYIDLQQDLVRENSKLIYMEEEYARQKEMLANNVTAKRDFQQSESNYHSQKAMVTALEQKITLLGLSPERVKKGEISSHISLISPINGYVKSTVASIGKYCLPEMVLFEIIDISHMHLELKVFEKDAAKIVKGQKVIFYQPGAENKKIDGSVWLMSKNLDLATRTVGVHVHFDENQAPGILPGMYVSACIEADKRRVLAVPEKAVFRTENKNFVFCLKGESKNGKDYEKKWVELGNSDNGWIEIEDPEMLIGKKIVTDGGYYLSGEMKKAKD